jgi:hypothetical protein
MLPGSPTAFNLTSLVTRRHPPGHAARIGAKPDCEPPRRAERTGNRFVATARKNSPENNRSAEIPGYFISPRSRDFGKRASALEKCPSRTLGEFCAVE